MRIDRHGQAKILTEEEIFSFFHEGCQTHRDKALFGTCLYTGCRISEARQMYYVDVFDGNKVRDEITIRKCNSKGKRATRSIPTHRDLAILLEQYLLESLELNRKKEEYGNWGTLSHNVMSRARCPRCQSIQTKKKGFKDGRQKYKCTNCNFNFREPDRAGDDPTQIDRCSTCGSDWVIEDGIENEKQTYTCCKCNRSFHESHSLKKQSSQSCSYSLIELVSTEDVDYLGVKDINNYGLLFAVPGNPYLFPGYKSEGCLSERRALKIFEDACTAIDLKGAGTHSFRRTTLTQLHNRGVPLRVIQKISGHSDLASLQTYLEVTEEQVYAAVHLLS